MALQAPNLDDRTFDDLVTEAVRIVQQQCPEWTDLSPSDPGRTLIEVMAWLAETIIYRLNRVPDRHYIKFLSLLGIQLRPAEAARAWVVFETKLAGGATQHLPANTTLLAPAAGSDGSEVRFATARGLDLGSGQVVGLVSRAGDAFDDHGDWLRAQRAAAVTGPSPATVFRGQTQVPHDLYLGDALLGRDDTGAARTGEQLELQVSLLEGLRPPEIAWEYHSAHGWKPIVPLSDDTEGLRHSGMIRFGLPALLQPLSLGGLDNGYWLRARITRLGDGVPIATALTRRFVARRLPLALRIQRPALVRHEVSVREEEKDFAEVRLLTQMDLPAVFRPFGERGIVGSELRVASPLFGRSGARVTLHINQRHDIAFEQMEQLKLSWDCWVGEWLSLGTTDARVVEETRFDLSDETDAFSCVGARRIAFRLPADPKRDSFDGVDSYWIRVRVVAGEYGKHGQLSPELTSLEIECEDQPRPFPLVLSQSGGEQQAITLQEAEPLYRLGTDRDPEICIGLSEVPVQNRRCSILLRVAARGSRASLRWEYLTDGWQPLPRLQDGTRGFAETGIVDFVPPADWRPDTVNGQEAYWLRARWVAGSRGRAPKLAGVHVNAVEALQGKVLAEHRLGSGSGAPNQRFALGGAVLPGITLRVRELAAAELTGAAERVRDLLARPELAAEERPDGLWTRWLEVDAMLLAKPDSRVFTLNPDRTEVMFGDGRLGFAPPAGADNVLVEKAVFGGGSVGNVPAGAIRGMLTSVPSVARVFNPEPATGGAEEEDLETAKQRAPQFIRSQDRAVTLADHEALALAASPEVARARCVQTPEGVRVIVLPQATAADPAPHPSAGLIRCVRRYLDERRMMNVVVDVRGPEYEPVDLDATVVVFARYAENLTGLASQVEEALHLFLHPLLGRGGLGWAMGRVLRVSEIFQVLEQLAYVAYVEEVRLNGSARRTKVDVPAHGFPVLRQCRLSLRSEGA